MRSRAWTGHVRAFWRRVYPGTIPRIRRLRARERRDFPASRRIRARPRRNFPHGEGRHVRRPRAYEMVRPRKQTPLLPLGTRWKVMARYVLRLTRTKLVPCVRVSAIGGTG